MCVSVLALWQNTSSRQLKGESFILLTVSEVPVCGHLALLPWALVRQSVMVEARGRGGRAPHGHWERKSHKGAGSRYPLQDTLPASLPPRGPASCRFHHLPGPPEAGDHVLSTRALGTLKIQACEEVDLFVAGCSRPTIASLCQEIML